MNYSDDQVQNEPIGEVVTDESVVVDTQGETMPNVVPVARARKAEEPNEQPEPTPFSDEIITIIFKSLFVALSVVAMLACILAIALPLQTMRIFNSMGNFERAIDFGERYVQRRLDEYSAGATDERGNYIKLSQTPALTDGEMTEALYVLTRLSNKLTDRYNADGNAARRDYYAKVLEKYTRMYLSLNDLGSVTTKTDYDNIMGMPSLAMRPAVYSYAHEMRTLNFRARAFLGKTELMTYDNRRINPDDRGVLTDTLGRIDYFVNTNPATDAATVQMLDDFVDYVDALGEYLDVEFMRIGVENNVNAKHDVKNLASGEMLKDIPVNTELYVRNAYVNVLDGNEFSLFITDKYIADDTTKGFTHLYNGLKACFGKYAQWAVEITPASGSGEDKLSGNLRQLYWIYNLSKAAQRLKYMELLLYYSQDNLGPNRAAVVEEYGTWRDMVNVSYNSRVYQLSEIYAEFLKQYMEKYQNG